VIYGRRKYFEQRRRTTDHLATGSSGSEWTHPMSVAVSGDDAMPLKEIDNP